MICPECKCEYRDDFVFCEDCNVSLVAELPEEVPLEEIQWVPLENLPGEIYAEMVKESLEQASIPCYIKTDFIASAFGVKGAGIPGSKARIFVPEHHYDQAAEILNEMLDQP